MSLDSADDGETLLLLLPAHIYYCKNAAVFVIAKCRRLPPPTPYWEKIASTIRDEMKILCQQKQSTCSGGYSDSPNPPTTVKETVGKGTHSAISPSFNNCRLVDVDAVLVATLVTL